MVGEAAELARGTAEAARERPGNPIRSSDAHACTDPGDPVRTHDVEQAFANLLQEHLGPRWEVTRDVIGRHPEGVDDLLAAISEDLQQLGEQLRDANGRQRETDLRITVEHVVVLLSRLLPVVGSVAADLYMTSIHELEG